MKYGWMAGLLLAGCAQTIRVPDAALDAQYQAEIAQIEAIAAEQGGDTAYAPLRARAEAGNRYAQMRLAEWHSHGKQQDLAQAREWLEKSARQGYAPAQYRLALLSRGDEREIWLKHAADQGYAPAQTELAGLHEAHGAAGDVQGLYEQAARQGDAQAQYALGRRLLDGGDAGQGLHWLELAAEQGHANAQFELGMAHLARGDTARGTAWLQRAENAGHAGARKVLRR